MDDISSIPQVWAMYKEVMGYFADGMSVPDDGMLVHKQRSRYDADPVVIELLAEDNWGNLVAVLPWGDNHTAGGGIYYHADCEFLLLLPISRAHPQTLEIPGATSGSTPFPSPRVSTQSGFNKTSLTA